MATSKIGKTSSSNFTSRVLFACINILCILGLIGLATTHAKAAKQNCSAVSQLACDTAHNLGTGINMGNMLEAPNEGDWGVRLDPSYVDLVADKFKTVRIPIRWSNHASADEQAIIDEFFFRRVERVVDDFLSKGMYVIINMHHYQQLNGAKLNRKEFEVDDSVVQARFINMWKQISHRFKNKSSKLIFEILNEPHKKLEGKAWYNLMNKAMFEIRKENPNRIVMIAPSGNRVPSLGQLAGVLNKDYDKNIILAVHNYDPVQFTFQGISWMPHFPKGVTCCDSQQKNIIQHKLNTIVKWNAKFGVPVHLGEFGSVMHGDIKSRVNYTKEVIDLLNRNSIGWTYWEFASTFGIYSPKKKQWNPLMQTLTNN